MRIEIDGSPIKEPEYASSFSIGKFAEYVSNTYQYDPEKPVPYIWRGARGQRTDADVRIFESIATDPDLPKYKESIIKRGVDNRDSSILHSAQSIAGQLADELAKKDEFLELVPTKKFTHPDSTWTARQDEGKGAKKDAFPSIPHVHKGTVVFRGDVDEVTGVWGGTVYVDGDVNEVIQNQSGIIYVRGDVYNLTDTEKAITIVGGKIHNFYQRRNSRGGLGLEVTPSPFIFSSEPIENKKADEFKPGFQGQRDRELTIEIPPSAYIVSHGTLRDWMPEETKQKALNLCRIRINEHFMGLMNIVTNLKDPNDFARFAILNMFGYKSGYIFGIYEGASRYGAQGDD